LNYNFKGDKKMKTFFVTLMMIVMVQGVAYGEENPGRENKLERIKEKVLGNIEKRRSFLNDFESCIKSANSREDLKSCKKENKKRMEAFRSEKKEKRKKMKEKKEKRRKEKD
jgi:hypothetical protein|tara:strand:- start:848 stop:1183 length:336 start_codon:yes stop_codon:yes gene_type:complete